MFFPSTSGMVAATTGVPSVPSIANTLSRSISFCCASTAFFGS